MNTDIIRSQNWFDYNELTLTSIHCFMLSFWCWNAKDVHVPCYGTTSMFNINQISITKKHQACTLETKPNLDGGGYKSIMKYQITWEASIVISVSSAKRRTIRQNEGLKCTMNLQIMDSHTPWMIVCDSGEHHYTCPLFPFFIAKSKEKAKQSEC